MSRPSPRHSPDRRSARPSRCLRPPLDPARLPSNPKFPVIVTKLEIDTLNPVTATLSVPGAAWIIALIPPTSPSAEPRCNPSSSCSNPPKTSSRSRWRTRAELQRARRPPTPSSRRCSTAGPKSRPSPPRSPDPRSAVPSPDRRRLIRPSSPRTEIPRDRHETRNRHAQPRHRHALRVRSRVDRCADPPTSPPAGSRCNPSSSCSNPPKPSTRSCAGKLRRRTAAPEASNTFVPSLFSSRGQSPARHPHARRTRAQQRRHLVRRRLNPARVFLEPEIARDRHKTAIRN